jgi:hypothetical protein
VSTNLSEEFAATHRAAKELNRALTDALTGWEYQLEAAAHRWTFQDDGLWSVVSMACVPQVSVETPDSSGALAHAWLRDFEPARILALLTAMGAPEVTA